MVEIFKSNWFAILFSKNGIVQFRNEVNSTEWLKNSVIGLSPDSVHNIIVDVILKERKQKVERVSADEDDTEVF